MSSSRRIVAAGVLRVVSIGWLGLSLSSSTASAQLYFYNVGNFATGNNASGLAAADFNGDGKLDLAVTNYTDNTVSILLGQRRGTFKPQVAYATGNNPNALLAADFNGDGKLDLAVVNVNQFGAGGVGSSVSILLGNGDGTFQSHTDYATGRYSVSIVAADFNGDGKLDLAVANQADNTVSVLLGNGDGTFQNQAVIPVGFGPVTVVAADFNGDGKVDLVSANDGEFFFGGPSLSVLLGRGDGTFARTDTPLGFGVTSAATADFNSDGKPDLAISNQFGFAVMVLPGNGDGTFGAATALTVDFQPTLLLAGDFNRDGKQDLAVASGRFFVPTAVAVTFGNGDGTFKAPVDVATGGTPLAFVIDDFNGDGAFDLALTSNSNSVGVLLGNRNGTFGSETQLTLASGTGPAVVADFDGDGKLDLAVAQSGSTQGVLTVFDGEGDGTFKPIHSTALNAAGESAIVLGDFNGDGRIDIAGIDITSSLSPSFSVLLGIGNGAFHRPVTTVTPSSLPLTGIAAGDFNGDGKTDLAIAVNNVSSGISTIAIYLSNGDATFHAGATYSFADFNNPWVLATDLNHDGRLDLAVTNGNEVDVLLGNGDGTFQNLVAYSLGSFNAHFLAAADFNGDGNIDLAAAGDFGVSVLLGNGDGTFQPHIDTTAPTGFGPPAVADFNGDGNPDLALNDGTFVYLLISKGQGAFETPVVVPVTAPLVVVAGDFNSDGFPDLAAPANQFLGPSFVSVILSTPAAGLFPSTLKFGPQAVGTSSKPKALTLSNIGNAPLTVTDVTTSGNYSQTNSCEASLKPGSSCAARVTFTPLAAGASPGTLTFTDNTLSSPQAISLTGTGKALH